MKKRMFAIDVDTGFNPEDGTEFDAVRDALEFSEVPAFVTQNAEGRIFAQVTGDCSPGNAFTVVCDALDFADIPAEVTEV